VPTLPYHVVDVFTDRPFAGNALAVVLDADDLPTGTLQDIAREFGLSETAFPMRSEVADYRLRIFTPADELPFAGHPSVGTAWLLGQLKRVALGEVRQECGVGVLPLEVAAVGATLTGGPPSAGEPLDPAPFRALLGLDPAPAGAPAPRVAGCGVNFVFVPVSAAEVGTLTEPEQAAVARAVGVVDARGLVVFAWDPAQRRSHNRVFFPGIGEDPATGAAAVAFGVYLAAAGLVDPDDITPYSIDQGAEIHRPSLLTCTVTTAGGAAVATTVGGRVARVATGELLVPPA
jgi:trans-2,3-dihydro-3-hydroxyanthranilate isomerase